MRYTPSRRLAFALSLAAGVAGATSGSSARPRPAAAPASPFLGRWQLDLTRMPGTYGTPPRQVVYRFEKVGDGRWRTTVDITARDGGVRHMVVTYRTDGTAARGEGDTSEADSAAIIIPAPNVMVMNLARNKMPGSVRVYVVSADGGEMTESAANVDDKGEPFVRNFHFKRMR